MDMKRSLERSLGSIRIKRDQNATVYPFKVVLYAHIIRRGMKEKKKAMDV